MHETNATVLQDAQAESQICDWLLSVEVNRNMRCEIASVPYAVYYKGANWDAAKMV